MRRPSTALRTALTVALSLTLGAFAPAHAAPVNYDDTLAGKDLTLDRNGLPVTLFDLDVGVNVVKGRESSLTSPFFIDTDGFRFNIGAGLRLDSIVMEYAFTGIPTPGNPNPNRYCQQWQLSNAVRAALDVQTVDPLDWCGLQVDLKGMPIYAPVVASGARIFDIALPLTHGNFDIRSTGGQFGPGGGHLDYVFKLNVSSLTAPPPSNVPEPGTFALLAGALVAGLVRRRRQAGIR